jgi:cell division inhibitor SepF
MSAFRNVTQGFRSLWGQGGDEYDDAEETEQDDAAKTARQRPDEPRQSGQESDPFQAEEPQSRPTRGVDARRDERYPRYTAPAPRETPDYGGSGSSTNGPRRLRPVSMPLRAREKNIYTLKPKSMDEASLAADYLKTGCAVVVNLEEVERLVAVRIIDFMSGVCYGLEHQGHAMKLATRFSLHARRFRDFQRRSRLRRKPRFHLQRRRDPTANRATSRSATQSSAAERRSWER